MRNSTFTRPDGAADFRRRRPGGRRCSLVLALALGASAVRAADPTPTKATNSPPLLDLSLEQLMNIKVTSVSKKDEPLSQSAAAVSVITQDDIRRSGVTDIPDALRLAPGVDVGRVDAHTWAVGVRGLNDTFSQSLLTLIDGRTVYSPLFSGTLWMSQDVMLEDVDRIEVIRGPGETLWGANAFNGVINIVTKPANETQGWLMSGGSGSQEPGAAAARYGDKLGPDTYFRVYGKYDAWDDFESVQGGSANDQWWKGQGGFRIDHLPAADTTLTLQGDYYYLSANQDTPRVSLAPPYRSTVTGLWNQTGGNLLGRATHAFSETSELTVQAYYDGEQFDMPLLQETRHTLDLDLRHRVQLFERHELVWGGGYRVNASTFDGSYEVNLLDDSSTEQIFNTFVQDEVTLVPDHLRLTLGTKLEHNDFTGFEWEPSARLAWVPTRNQTVWAAVSRAVRTPSQMERSALIHLTVLPPASATSPETLISAMGSSAFSSEEVLAYEAGYRVQPHPRVTVDAAAFYHTYRGLRGSEEVIDTSALPSYLQVIGQMNNSINGDTYGGELSASWQATTAWRLTATYSLLESDLTNAFATGPINQASLRSSLNVTRDVDFDLWARYTGMVSNSGTAVPGVDISPTIPAFFTFDARIAWRPVKNLELSLVGQNLLSSPHREFNPTYLSTEETQISRSVFGKITWRF